VTRELADEIAAELYGGHPAAAALVLEAVHGATAERRARSWRALMALDPDNRVPNPGDDLGRAIGDVLVGCLRHADDRERRRLARLLAAVCREAEQLAARRRELEAA